MGSDEPPPSLPWYADPAMGAVIGMTFLLFCLVGPFALLIPLIGWLVIRHRRQEGMRSTAEGELAERVHDRESEVFDEPPPPSRPKRAPRKRRR